MPESAIEPVLLPLTPVLPLSLPAENVPDAALSATVTRVLTAGPVGDGLGVLRTMLGTRTGTPAAPSSATGTARLGATGAAVGETKLMMVWPFWELTLRS